MLEKGYEFVGANPDEAIKIGEHLLKREVTESEKSQTLLLIAQGYYRKGAYDHALKILFEAGKNQNLPWENQVKILLLKAELTRKLHLNEQAEKYFAQAGKILQSATGEKDFLQALFMTEKTRRALQQKEFKQALSLSDSLVNYPHIFTESPRLYQQWCLNRAEIYKKIAVVDSAVFYYQKMLEAEQHTPDLSNKSMALNELSSIYFDKKQYEKAIALLLQSQQAAQKLDNTFLLLSIKSKMIPNYLILKDKENQNVAHREFLVLKTKSQNLENSALNMAYNLISQEEEEHYQLQKNSYSKNLRISIGILIVMALTTVFFFVKNSLKLKGRNEIIKYLEASNNLWSQKKKSTPKSEISRKNNIPTETEQAILTKLKRFESSVKFTNKEMSLALLASQFDTNTKYLSEIINTHYNENFNSYINRLRVGFIIEKLKSDPNYLNYKISYLADQCGFSSHSSFATVFKSVTGIAPTTFIELMQNEQNNQQQTL
ncbi:MAG: helix-turn-helix domain-containing protein [Flavobacteriaceae bacterium]